MNRGVYVRGVGAWTPLGETWPGSFDQLRRGASAIGPLEAFDPVGFPCAVAASIPGCRLSGRDPRCVLGLSAAREAWEMARLSASPERIGVFVGAEAGRPSFATVVNLARAGNDGATFDHERFARNARALAGKIEPSVLSPAAVASSIAHEIGARGPMETICLACASGAAAMLEGVRAIRLGQCDVALCGGVGADVDPFAMAGFGLLSALSGRGISRPFDVRRDGFVLGEGAGMVVLSSERGESSVEVAGVALTLDGYRLTAPEPTGAAAARAMKLAMADAHVTTVDHVQAHGTSTPLNDAIEAATIRNVLGPNLARALVSSVKGALGHSIAGGGAIGLLCAFEAISSGTILPTMGLEQPDPACDLPHVMGEAIKRDTSVALVNSFGFGGANCSIVLRRCA